MDEDPADEFTSNFASHGAVIDTNYSPTNQVTYPVAVDPSYFAEPETVSPTALVAGFFDCDPYFELPFSFLEQGADPLADQAPPGTALPPATDTRVAYDPSRQPISPAFPNPPLLGQLEPSVSSFSFGSSLSEENTRQGQSLTSEHPSRRQSLKREPTDEEIAPPTQATPRPRKRGRPRLSQTQNKTSTPTSIDDSSSTRSRRLPHHQVERKYRENLNTELERLRRAIPAAPPNATEGRATEQAKLSKAMVLAGAIDYIERLERERDEYQAECERLRGLMGGKGRAIE